MKKIFTLLFATAMLSSAFAQYGSRDDRDYKNGRDVVINDGQRGFDKDDNRFGGKYYFTAREKDMQIARINREYDYKIQSVKSKFLMSWMQKKRQIEFLKDQREKEIFLVIAKFKDRRNQCNDYGYDKRNHW